MNRREFLQALFAVTSTAVLPAVDLMAAPAEVIDQVWEKIKREPSFYVSSWGTIYAAGEDVYPNTRAELYEIKSPADLEDVCAIAQDYSRVQCHIEDALNEAGVEDIEALTEEQQDNLLNSIQYWAEGWPDEYDAEYMTLTGRNRQGEAKRYFELDFEYCDEFNIVIVEGDCPGSSYFAAELRMSVEDANELAEAMDLPIRFAWEA